MLSSGFLSVAIISYSISLHPVVEVPTDPSERALFGGFCMLTVQERERERAYSSLLESRTLKENFKGILF